VNIEVAGFDEPISGKLLSLESNGQAMLNLLHLRAGRIVQAGRADEAVVNDAFANAHGLQLGDAIHVIIKGRRKAITIVGIGLSPEYVYQLRPGSMFPDYQRYAILWMGREVLASAYDMQGAFNDVVLTLRADASARDVINHLDALLDTYGGFGAYARADQLSHKYLTEEFKQLQRSSAIFPVLFLGVAAFLLDVVISRVINTQREQIATLKAFGYRNFAIALHYFKLVLAVAHSAPRQELRSARADVVAHRAGHRGDSVAGDSVRDSHHRALSDRAGLRLILPADQMQTGIGWENLWHRRK